MSPGHGRTVPPVDRDDLNRILSITGNKLSPYQLPSYGVGKPQGQRWRVRVGRRWISESRPVIGRIGRPPGTFALV
jgi:hypothetical protein